MLQEFLVVYLYKTIIYYDYYSGQLSLFPHSDSYLCINFHDLFHYTKDRQSKVYLVCFQDNMFVTSKLKIW